jgi:hypothetical protein
MIQTSQHEHKDSSICTLYASGVETLPEAESPSQNTSRCKALESGVEFFHEVKVSTIEANHQNQQQEFGVDAPEKGEDNLPKDEAATHQERQDRPDSGVTATRCPAINSTSVQKHTTMRLEMRQEDYLRSLFDRFAHKNDEASREAKISKQAFVAAFDDLHRRSSKDNSELFREYDMDSDSQINFEDFKAAALRPTLIELWCQQIPWWQAVADAIPVPHDQEDPLQTVAQLTDADIRVICEEAEKSLLSLLTESVHQLKKAYDARSARAESSLGIQSKFTTFKASAGTCDNFHDGLSGRVGEPDLKFLSEHLRDCVGHAQGRRTASSSSPWSSNTAPSLATISVSPQGTMASPQLQKKNGPSWFIWTRLKIWSMAAQSDLLKHAWSCHWSNMLRSGEKR